MGDLETHVSADAAIVMSAEHYPVLTITWFGRPTPGTVEAYAQWLMRLASRVHEQGERFVIVGDMTGIRGRLDPQLRRKMAEVLQRFHDTAGDCLLGVFTVVDKPVMRTLIKMTLYVARRAISITPVASLPEAIERALARLEEAGVPPPPSLDAATYRRPAHPMDEG